jgi:hypothetical protein
MRFLHFCQGFQGAAASLTSVFGCGGYPNTLLAVLTQATEFGYPNSVLAKPMQISMITLTMLEINN